MTKYLSTLLGLVSEIEQRKSELGERRAKIRESKERVFENAGPDDAKAFAKIGELGSQENLLTIQIEKADRELAGTAASILNECGHVKKKVRAALQKMHDETLASLSEKLEDDYPDKRDRAAAIASLRPIPPQLFSISRHLAGISHVFTPDQDERAFARQILGEAESAIQEFQL